MAKINITMNVTFNSEMDAKKLARIISEQIVINGGSHSVIKLSRESEEAKLEVGDYAKVINVYPSSFGGKIGDIVKLERSIETYGGGFKVSKLDGGFYGGNEKISASSLVKATEAEIAETIELARWSKIGRKPNELKEGDVIEVTGECEGGKYYGEIVGDIYNDRFKFKHFGADYKSTEFVRTAKLITPVEARFDRD